MRTSYVRRAMPTTITYGWSHAHEHYLSPQTGGVTQTRSDLRFRFGLDQITCAIRLSDVYYNMIQSEDPIGLGQKKNLKQNYKIN